MSLGEILSCLREDCRKVPNMQNNNSSSGGLSCGTLLEVSTYSILTPWSRVLLQKLTGFQLVKKFPAFYGTRRFITAVTSAHHLSLSWASSIQSGGFTNYLKI